MFYLTECQGHTFWFIPVFLAIFWPYLLTTFLVRKFHLQKCISLKICTDQLCPFFAMLLFIPWDELNERGKKLVKSFLVAVRKTFAASF